MANSKKSKQKEPKIPSSLIPFTIEVKPGGRPTALTPTILLLLREAFLLGCDDLEACTYAGIAPQTLYNHQKNNSTFLEWKESLKRQPFLKARKAIVNELEHNPQFALAFMERKKKAEFAPSAKISIDDQRETLDDETKQMIGGSIAEHLNKLKAKSNADTEIARSVSTDN